MTYHEFLLVSLDKADEILVKDVVPIVDCKDVNFSTPLDAMFSIRRSMGSPIKDNGSVEYVVASTRKFCDELVALIGDKMLEFENNATIIVEVGYECDEFSSKMTYTKDSRGDSIRRIFGPIKIVSVRLAYIREGLKYGG